MLRDLYFRDDTDNKYKWELIETNSKLEAVLNKVRMILFTTRGSVFGEPNLGMNLEDYLFNFNFDEQDLKSKFNAQVNQYIPEQGSDFRINMDVSLETDGVKNFCYLYIYVNQQLHMTVVV